MKTKKTDAKTDNRTKQNKTNQNRGNHARYVIVVLIFAFPISMLQRYLKTNRLELVSCVRTNNALPRLGFLPDQKKTKNANE